MLWLYESGGVAVAPGWLTTRHFQLQIIATYTNVPPLQTKKKTANVNNGRT